MIPPIASRFVAGETQAEALEHARQLRDREIHTICNVLGEHHHERRAVSADVDRYRQLCRDIGRTDLEACVSVKPTQIGLGIDETTFMENLGAIVGTARDMGVFVWIDMEDRTTTDATLNAFERFVTEYPEMGVCIQANLQRTEDDLRRLVELPGTVRLVKGAYDEPKNVAYTDRSAVNEQYRTHLKYLFSETSTGAVAVGSHDPQMIDRAIELHDAYGTPFEIQMLMGVREDAQAALAAEHDVYQYVPYGKRWASYFFRRVVERRENLTFALRAILER
ncbi:proline dehydrogenase family protein [Halocatena pleomorpha]|uniref:proline dehydrogenase n=1 Tax=Halocatena pleomorpha TaxID=1785090 RepID=A0A3P3RI02_9EURY|nr:proline dehydrogenase family protein [Halocatena pleomorpha]RRJ32073.1 proline dehydrogenase [Halocatena pleomorpha]